MLNFGASKPRVKGGPGPPPGSAPGVKCLWLITMDSERTSFSQITVLYETLVIFISSGTQ